MKVFWKVVGFIGKLIPAKVYKSAALKMIEKKAEPEKEVIGPKTKFNTGRLDYRDIENKKRKPS